MNFKTMIRRSHAYKSLTGWRRSSDLRSWRPTDQRRFGFYSQFVRTGDLVFDVGANVGNRSKVFLKLGARVVAFEPQLDCANLLRSVLSGHEAFHLITKALGSDAGVATLQLGDSHVLSTLSARWIAATSLSGRFGASHWTGSQEVEVTTLDRVIEQFGIPAFIKIDVEGYEVEVLAGLNRPLPSGSIEFATENLQELTASLRRLDQMETCRYQFAAGEVMAFAWPQWMRLNEALDALHELSRADPRAWGDIYFSTEKFARDRRLT